MFERIEVLGNREAIVHPMAEAEAHGWRELWGDAVLAADHRGRPGRGERSQTSGTDLFVPVAWPLPVRLG